MIAAENLKVGMRVIRSMPPQETGTVVALGEKGSLTVKFDDVKDKIGHVTTFLSASHLDKLSQWGGMLKNWPLDNISLIGENIFVKEGDPEWEEAHKNWLAGKSPTSNPLWKLGVYFQRVEI